MSTVCVCVCVCVPKDLEFYFLFLTHQSLRVFAITRVPHSRHNREHAAHNCVSPHKMFTEKFAKLPDVYVSRSEWTCYVNMSLHRYEHYSMRVWLSLDILRHIYYSTPQYEFPWYANFAGRLTGSCQVTWDQVTSEARTVDKTTNPAIRMLTIYSATFRAPRLSHGFKYERLIYKYCTAVVRCAMEWCLSELAALSVNWFIRIDTVQFRRVSWKLKIDTKL